MYNPYAIYVNCDGAMDYEGGNPGGVGFLITFPDSVGMEPIPISIGIYVGGNIERLELEALIQAMQKTLDVFEQHQQKLKNINRVIFITDRHGLREEGKTSPYAIKEWRSNGWRNFEGKPIKNHKLLDELDKLRKKLADKSHSKISIEFRRRKQNKAADKLAKAGKYQGIRKVKLANKGEKIGKRRYDGTEVLYKVLRPNEPLHIHVFRKDQVQNEWEVWAEVCEGIREGNKLKIYTDNVLAGALMRGNEFYVVVKEVFRYHIKIFPEIQNCKNEEEE